MLCCLLLRVLTYSSANDYPALCVALPKVCCCSLRGCVVWLCCAVLLRGCIAQFCCVVIARLCHVVVFRGYVAIRCAVLLRALLCVMSRFSCVARTHHNNTTTLLSTTCITTNVQ